MHSLIFINEKVSDTNMVKYGVESQENLEHCLNGIRNKTMSLKEAVKKCYKHGISVTEDELAEMAH